MGQEEVWTLAIKEWEGDGRVCGPKFWALFAHQLADE
jgi:hypothetical protein